MTLFNALFTPRPGPQVWVWVIGSILFFVALMAGLHMLPGPAKRRLIVVATFLSGLFYFLEFMLPSGFLAPPPPADAGAPAAGTIAATDNFLTPAITRVADFALVIGAMALGLGILNLVQIHGKALVRMRGGWQNPFIFFVGFIAMTVVGLVQGNLPDVPLWRDTNTFLFEGLLMSLEASVFGLLAFYIASAAFRAFRVTSVESTLMMVTAFIVMLGNVGSEVLTGWIPPDSALAFLRLDNITFWIMSTVNMSAQRALLFGIAVGTLATSLRIWLSLERGHYFGREV